MLNKQDEWLTLNNRKSKTGRQFGNIDNWNFK